MPTRRTFIARALASLAAAAGLSRLAGGAGAAAPEPAKVNGGAWVPPLASKFRDVRGYPGWRWWLTDLQWVPVPGEPNTVNVRASYVAARFDEQGRIVEMVKQLPEA
jgi:hypothetical protein